MLFLWIHLKTSACIIATSYRCLPIRLQLIGLTFEVEMTKESRSRCCNSYHVMARGVLGVARGGVVAEACQLVVYGERVVHPRPLLSTPRDQTPVDAQLLSLM